MSEGKDESKAGKGKAEKHSLEYIGTRLDAHLRGRSWVKFLQQLLGLLHHASILIGMYIA